MLSIGSDLQGFAARYLVPHQFQLSSVHHFAPHHSVLTSDFAISIWVPRSMKTLGRPCKMHNGQPRALEIAPVQPFIFVIFAIVIGRRFDFRDVPLNADQSNSYTTQSASANEIFNTYVLFYAEHTLFCVYRRPLVVCSQTWCEIKCVEVVEVEEADYTHPCSGDAIRI